MLAHPLQELPPPPHQAQLSKFIDDHIAQRRAIKEAIADKHRVRIALATEPYSPYNTLNS